MDNFKQASKKQLRFQTDKGVLSVEQLWSLSLPDIDKLAVSLKESYEKSSGKSFLDEKKSKDADIKLRFDIALEILRTKVADQDRARIRAERREKNRKILDIIGRKQDNELEGKSIGQLRKLLEETEEEEA